MNKMNDYTQGGGVQDVIWVQFKVLLPNGCQGQKPKESMSYFQKESDRSQQESKTCYQGDAESKAKANVHQTITSKENGGWQNLI